MELTRREPLSERRRRLQARERRAAAQDLNQPSDRRSNGGPSGPPLCDNRLRVFRSPSSQDKSERSIWMTQSLAFISPVLAEAAMEGRLPRSFSVKRLTDLPMLWSEQWRAVGLREPISGSSRTRLIHAVFDSLLTPCWGARSFGPTASIVQLGKRNFAG